MKIDSYFIKKICAQGNVRTFSDNLLLAILNNLNQLSHKDYALALNWYKARIFGGKRFTKFEADTPPRPELMETYMNFSQGFTDCMTWKGKPMLKTVYDMAILNMLIWDLKPQSIIEIGSGNGSSAEYMRDMAITFGLNTKVLSFDINPPTTKLDRVEFAYADCNEITSFTLLEDTLKALPRPLLIVEDAHVNVRNVLGYFATFVTTTGDYFFVEDTETKQADIKDLMGLNINLRIDRKYTDYFGPNMTSATNGILKCL